MSCRSSKRKQSARVARDADTDSTGVAEALQDGPGDGLLQPDTSFDSPAATWPAHHGQDGNVAAPATNPVPIPESEVPMDESARQVANDPMKGAVPYLYSSRRVTRDVHTHPPSPCCGPIIAGQRKLSPDVIETIFQRVGRTLRLKSGPSKASPKLAGVEALTHELLLAVLESLEECAADAEEGGLPVPSSRDSARAFAWAMADIMGATLSCADKAFIKDVAYRAGRRLERQAQTVREAIVSEIKQRGEERAQARSLCVLSAGALAAKLAAIDAAEQAELSQQLHEVYVGFHEIEVSSDAELEELEVLEAAAETRQRAPVAAAPTEADANAVFGMSYDAGYAHAEATAESMAKLLASLQVNEQSLAQEETDELRTEVKYWKAKAEENGAHWKREWEKQQQEIAELESELADTKAREDVLRSIVVEHLQCCKTD
jgi:hypothetical protein